MTNSYSSSVQSLIKKGYTTIGVTTYSIVLLIYEGKSLVGNGI